MLRTIAVSGYRSLRDVVVPLHGLDVVTGANGSGKSSLYRALRLLAGCSRGEVVGSLAREGGLGSALWAGPATLGGARTGGHEVQGTVRKGPISLRLGFASDDFGYLVDLGLPQQAPGSESAFLRDPEIKREVVWSGPVMRPGSVLVRRRWSVVEARDGRGWRELTRGVAPWESMVSELSDPFSTPELIAVRRMMRGWRFYDGFRSDAAAPARQVAIGTRTPVLADDGADLAAAIQTIRENGSRELDAAVADAFDGARLEVSVADGRFDLQLHQPGMLRPLSVAELSDGTLRYLLWAAALLTVSPPGLMVLNEPETSLHPDLLAPLARLVRQASAYTQVLVVTHAAPLIDALEVTDDDDADTGLGSPARGVRLVKDLGETFVEGQGMLTTPQWEWGSRR
ncbi:AAA family ATPase [Luteipulveratus halotolerans]|uniref:ATP-binding protein n=1 Tax=Luteipulveratus halotolerans TaxID=1631356 RepID=A0A0L6CIE1_9MICO|nr:AAA family ATPase [Luteipulveratus halotolerans]KNX37562.1 ATP-binding protein [Luteipulveratus halotolerans]